jgi:hypothetical protein
MNRERKRMNEIDTEYIVVVLAEVVSEIYGEFYRIYILWAHNLQSTVRIQKRDVVDLQHNIY